MRRHTPEQAAILSLFDQMKVVEKTLLARVEALEAENRALHGRVSSVVAQLRAAQGRPSGHLRVVTDALDRKVVER